MYKPIEFQLITKYTLYFAFPMGVSLEHQNFFCVTVLVTYKEGFFTLL